jgi:hypothetical protein
MSDISFSSSNDQQILLSHEDIIEAGKKLSYKKAIGLHGIQD